MVFEPNFTRIVSSARKNIGITQSVIELKLPTNEETIDTIYSVSAKSSIVSSEVVGNDINFFGLVDFQAMYESAGVTAIDYSAEFKDKYTSDSEVHGETIVSTNVIDVTSSIVAGGIKVVAIVEITIDEIESKDINVLTGITGDNIHMSQKTISYNTFIGKANEKFDISEEFEISNASKILMVTPSICLRSVNVGINLASIHGTINVDVCYQSGEDNFDIRSRSECFDFNYEVALDGIDNDSYIQSMISIVTNEIKVSSVIGENATISMFVPIQYVGYVFNCKTIEVLDDVYSMTNYLSVTSENFDSLMGYPLITFKDTISGTANISDTAPFIDDILGVCTNNIVLASSRVENDRLNIEGVANVTVVYYTKDLISMTAVEVEMPFAVEEKVEGMVSSVVTLCLTQVNARSKRGKEIEVSADLGVYSDMFGINSSSIISNITLGEEKPFDDCSLYIYIVRPGDTWWSIAKEMNTSVETIRKQNPSIDETLIGGERLVIYKPNLIDY